MAFYVQEEVRDSSTGIVDMVRRASHKKNRIAMVAGFVAGGWIPTVTYLVSHYHVQAQPQLWLLVGAGLGYSSITVYSWAKVAFKLPAKALSFVILMELSMTFVPSAWIGLPSLGLLVLINGLATGTNLVNDRRDSRQLARALPKRKVRGR